MKKHKRQKTLSQLTNKEQLELKKQTIAKIKAAGREELFPVIDKVRAGFRNIDLTKQMKRLKNGK